MSYNVYKIILPNNEHFMLAASDKDIMIRRPGWKPTHIFADPDLAVNRVEIETDQVYGVDKSYYFEDTYNYLMGILFRKKEYSND